jgi:hypothetical protein
MQEDSCLRRRLWICGVFKEMSGAAVFAVKALGVPSKYKYIAHDGGYAPHLDVMQCAGDIESGL